MNSSGLWASLAAVLALLFQAGGSPGKRRQAEVARWWRGLQGDAWRRCSEPGGRERRWRGKTTAAATLCFPAEKGKKTTGRDGFVISKKLKGLTVN